MGFVNTVMKFASHYAQGTSRITEELSGSEKVPAAWIRFVTVIAKDFGYAVSLRRKRCRKCVRRMLVCIVHSFLLFGGHDTFPNTTFSTNEPFLMFVSPLP